jgi:hypothetical protein
LPFACLCSRLIKPQLIAAWDFNSRFAQKDSNNLKLRTIVHGGIDITRIRENGIFILEISDPDALLELTVRKKSDVDCMKAAMDVEGPNHRVTVPAAAVGKPKEMVEA